MNQQLHAIFNAESIAVVGASATRGKMGHTILQNILDAGFSGKIYPINPKGETILDVKAFPSLSAVGEPIDLAVFTIPAAAMEEAMEQAGQCGVKAAVIITGGLSEVGNTALEQRILDIARRYGIRVVGPNCQGVVYTHGGICASWPLTTGKGPVAVISQSGTIGAAMAGWLIVEEIGVSGFVSMGNKADVDECDLLDFFAEDPHTKVIALNIEGVRNGERFVETCSRVSRKKPIVVLKPGRTPQGKEAAASHTKSIAGDAKVFAAVCRKAGLVQVETTQDFFDAVKALALAGGIRLPELVILTSSGGSGILAVDAAEDRGLALLPLSAKEQTQLRQMLPRHCVVRNPLDLTGDTDAQRYLTAAGALAPARSGALLLVFGDPIPGASEVVEKIGAMVHAQVVVCYIGGGETERVESVRIQRLGYPVYPTPERAVSAIRALCAYGQANCEKGAIPCKQS